MKFAVHQNLMYDNDLTWGFRKWMERKLIDMAPTMHPRLINDHRLLPDEVMECDCGCVIVSTDTLQLRNNFEECVFNQSTKSASKKRKESMSCRWVVNFMSQLYYTRERTPVPVKRKAGLVPDPVWTFGEGKNLLPDRNQTLDHPAYIQVTVLTTLFRLSSSNICNCR